jgi:hypothetical protein
MEPKRAPAGGYDFGEKEAYRRQLWNFFDQHLKDIPRKERQVLYLDSKEGLETECLIRKGYRAENLHPCNWDPAHAAVLSSKLRKAGQYVTSHGKDIFEVACDLKGKGVRIDAYNFDFTGCVSDSMLKNFELFILNNAPDKALISVNVLRGRENDAFRRLGFKIYEDNDGFRVQMFNNVITGTCLSNSGCRFHIHCFKLSTYKSGTQSRLVMSWKIVRHTEPSLSWVASLHKQLGERLFLEYLPIFYPPCLLEDHLTELKASPGPLLQILIKAFKRMGEFNTEIISLGHKLFPNMTLSESRELLEAMRKQNIPLPLNSGWGQLFH